MAINWERQPHLIMAVNVYVYLAGGRHSRLVKHGYSSSVMMVHPRYRNVEMIKVRAITLTVTKAISSIQPVRQMSDGNKSPTAFWTIPKRR